MCVVLLFEIFDDLDNVGFCMECLLMLLGYCLWFFGVQEVMIGYFDLVKDVGIFMVVWVQYWVQEKLVEICCQYEVELLFFYGCGGIVGCGGGLVYVVILLQLLGLVVGCFWVIEQGEMICFKFGLLDIVEQNFNFYFVVVLEVILMLLLVLELVWCVQMDCLVKDVLLVYCRVVCDDLQFVEYFCLVMFEQELGCLLLGSCLVKCCEGGVESLWVIFWIFVWIQMCLMLLVWFGWEIVLLNVIECGEGVLFGQMCE